jgi:hypothetical protein
MLVLIVHHLAKWTIDWVEWTLAVFLNSAVLMVGHVI